MRRVLFFVLILVLISGIAQAQDDTANVINDEGGPVLLTGEVIYTNPFFTSGVTAPLIILEDQTGFIDRNEYYLFPQASQTLGQITSDFYTSPFTYSLALPIEPQGTLRDVDHDGQEESGVMVFAVAYWDNTWGDPFLEERDQQGGGWSSAYASTRISSDPEKLREVVGGKYLIYAPEEGQGFPSGFGEDNLLFTEDDPIVTIPQGYSIVDLDADPFTFDRARHQTVDLIEPEDAALVDYSGLSYTEAFDAMVTMLSKEYAFTEYKELDWESLRAKYRPDIERAEESSSSDLYFRTMASFLWSIPDGHVNVGPLNNFVPMFFENFGKGIGIGIQETDDRHAYVTFLLEDSPAAQAGIREGAEILEINGRAVVDAISRVVPWGETYSTPHNKRLGQARFVTRFPQSFGEVEITYQNEGEEAKTVTVETSDELDSFFAGFEEVASTGFELPLEYRLLDNGYGYVKIYSFLDNRVLTIQLWERLMQNLRDNEVPGLVVDMRENGGGNGFLADQMTAYFFDEALTVGSRGSYNREIDAFFFDPRSIQKMYLPAEELRYDGPIAVLVGANCASACERFAYNMTLEERAAIVGHYPTAGLGGSVNDFVMPEGLTVRFTAGRSLDAEGNIHIEGLGVAPTIHVPVTRESLFTDGDPELDAAIEYLNAES